MISAICHFSLLPQHFGGLPNYVSDLLHGEATSRNMIHTQMKEFSDRISSFVGSFAADRLPGEFLIGRNDVLCLSNFNPESAFT